MKKLKFLVTAAAACLLAACTANPSKEASKEGSDPSSQEVSQNSQEQSNSQAQSQSNSQATSTSQAVQHVMDIDYAAKRADYVSTQLTVTATEDDETTPITDGHALANGVLTISKAGIYTLKGYLKGQVLVTVAGVTVYVNGAFLENDQGKAPIYCNVALTEANEKVEIKAKGINYVAQYGGTYNKNNKDTAGAIVSECNVDLGGKGSLYVVGSLKHGVKANKVTIKSEGVRYIQGSADGSAINCDTFVDKAGSNSMLYVINSKNGIKADKSISVTSEGTNINMYDCTVGMKTEKTTKKNSLH